MLAHTYSASLYGASGRLIVVECDVRNGLPALTIVGLGSKTVEESKERIKSALHNSGLEIPPKRVTMNLAPADMPKHGSNLDLAMSVAWLAALAKVPAGQASSYLFLGELSLNGSLRPVKGLIPLLTAVEQAPKVQTIVIPSENAREAGLVKDKYPILLADNLKQVYQHILGKSKLKPVKSLQSPLSAASEEKDMVDMQDITGQEHAKRALVVAAAGRHNILLTGPPGTGKTMLARALTGILPSPTKTELIEIIALHSLVLGEEAANISGRPFRNPHHTASTAALIGGGTMPRPGEISLAHHGVLFLDELPEYPRHALEALRQPLEDRHITVARSQDTLSYPAAFMLIATKNPCPCGYWGDPIKTCTCSANQINNYHKRISGPLIDRIDLLVEVARLDTNKLWPTHQGKRSKDYAILIKKARTFASQNRRQLKPNAFLTNKETDKWCKLDDNCSKLLLNAVEKFSLSSRNIKKIVRVARTIADLENKLEIMPPHLAEALQYRSGR